MKFLPMLTLATAAYALSDQAACANKRYGGSTVAAIQAFCSKTDMVVPSTYAQNGHTSGGQKVAISGKSFPLSYVS